LISGPELPVEIFTAFLVRSLIRSPYFLKLEKRLINDKISFFILFSYWLELQGTIYLPYHPFERFRRRISYKIWYEITERFTDTPNDILEIFIFIMSIE